MSLEEIIPNIRDFENLLISGNIKKFNVNQNGDGSAFTNQLSMSYREIKKMQTLFRLGPTRSSYVLTPDKEWSIGINLNKIRDNIKNKGLYGFLVYMENEGGTVWILTPDSKLRPSEDKDPLGEIINNDITSKRWNTAFDKAKSETGIEAPFAISYMGSITLQRIPFFGRMVYGTAMVNGVISLVQIPLMGKNKDDYFSWLYVPKDENLTPDDWENKTSGGGKTYNGFKEVRDYLINECEPLNNTGTYSFDPKDRLKKPQDQEPEDQNTDNKQNNNKNKEDQKEDTKKDDTQDSDNKHTGNPLIDQATGYSQNDNKKESYCLVEEALYKAKSFISEVYFRKTEGSSTKSYDDDEDWYKGNPFENKLNMNNGIPKFGPLY